VEVQLLLLILMDRQIGIILSILHMLMEEMDRFAAEKNCMYSILISSGFRQDAHRFYENCGFVDSVRGFRKVYRAFKE
jgi:hypothetical protein